MRIDLSATPTWLLYSLTIFAVATLLASVHLIRRGRSSRGAGVSLLLLSGLVHALLLLGLPMLRQIGSGGDRSGTASPPAATEPVEVSVSMLATMDFGQDDSPIDPAAAMPMGPLPIDAVATSIRMDKPTIAPEVQPLLADQPIEHSVDQRFVDDGFVDNEFADRADDAIDQWLEETAEVAIANDEASGNANAANDSSPDQNAAADSIASGDAALPPVSTIDGVEIATLRQPNSTAADAPVVADGPEVVDDSMVTNDAVVTGQPIATAAPGAAAIVDDYAARRGQSKRDALLKTGGSAETEAAVAAALAFLSRNQKSDGGFSPSASGAGRERSPLGFRRGGAGARAETGITGLALLAMMGAGNTHQDGEYSESVYRGLTRLIALQKPDGNMAGDASVYSSTYCHGMASLALAECAAMTGDASAIDAATAAVGYTLSMQHRGTGGWRYTQGDPGDLSQLGWQAMVLDGAHRAGIDVTPASVRGIERFLNSVRLGRRGGLASYRPGELPSRTMTAESMATHLLLGLPMTDEATAEGQQYLLSKLPGDGVDNYYYWYYATVALHQLQDDAWQRWNTALKRRLLSTQNDDGSWPATTLWGGYGGTIYTTAMATLCLETYYRHVLREEAKVARRSGLQR